jgi:AcrR family transcriptional regulator
LNPADPKKQQLLETARQLFFKHGIRRVSVEEICREAGVSKMTYYKHFRDKNGLIRTILEILQQEAVTRYRAIIHTENPYPEKVRAMIAMKLEQTDSMSREFYVDIHKHADPELIQLLDQMEKDGMNLIEKDFRKAQRQGHLRQGIHPEFIIYLLNKIIDMSHDEALLVMYPTPQAMIMELTNFFFYGILPAKWKESH